MTDRLSSLAAIEAAVWSELARACSDKTHPWRSPVLATVAALPSVVRVGTDGRASAATHPAGDARVVILREVDAGQRRLLMFTDARSDKVTQLLDHPHGTLVMWAPQLGWQLRCRVELSLETAGLATSSRWARIKHSPAAQDYMSPLPPGAPLPAQAPPHDAPQREHFGVITAQVSSIDWFDLHADGHRRAHLDGAASEWLQP